MVTQYLLSDTYFPRQLMGILCTATSNSRHVILLVRWKMSANRFGQVKESLLSSDWMFLVVIKRQEIPQKLKLNSACLLTRARIDALTSSAIPVATTLSFSLGKVSHIILLCWKLSEKTDAGLFSLHCLKVIVWSWLVSSDAGTWNKVVLLCLLSAALKRAI